MTSIKMLRSMEGPVVWSWVLWGTLATGYTRLRARSLACYEHFHRYTGELPYFSLQVWSSAFQRARL